MAEGTHCKDGETAGQKYKPVCIWGDGQVLVRIWEREAEVKQERRSLGMRESGN